MKKKLYIHIGFPKTGTSAMQSIGLLHSATLKQAGLIYVDFEEFNQTLMNGKIPSFKEFFKTLYARHRNKNYKFWISSEFLMGLGGAKYILKNNPGEIAQELYNGANEWFDIHIIAYLRRMDIWIESLYAQAIFDIESFSFEEYIEANDVYSIDYYGIIKSYIDVFGKDKITLRLFDKKYLHGNNSLLAQFSSILNCEILKTINIHDERIHTNSSYDRLTLEIARICNKQLKKDDNKLRTLRKVLRSVSDKSKHPLLFFSKTERSRLLEQNERSMQKLQKTLSLDFPDPLFSESECPDPVFELKIEDVISVCMAAIVDKKPTDDILNMKSLYILLKFECFLKNISIVKKIGNGILRLSGMHKN